jgi:hypothetical protein
VDNKPVHCDSYPAIRKDLKNSIDVTLPPRKIGVVKVSRGHKLVMNTGIDNSSNDNKVVSIPIDYKNVRMQSVPRTKKVSKINRSVAVSSGKEPSNFFHSKSIGS